MVNQPLSPRQITQLAVASFLIPGGATILLGALQYFSWGGAITPMSLEQSNAQSTQGMWNSSSV